MKIKLCLRALWCLICLILLNGALTVDLQAEGFRLQRFGYAPGIFVEEGEGATVFDVTVSVKPEPISVEYRVVGRSAVAGLDFVASSGVLHFPANTWRVDLNLEIIDDAEIEGNEEFEIQLFNPTAGVPIDTPSSIISLHDDERGYSILIQPGGPFENDPYFDVRVYRVGDFDFASTVQARLIPETAVAGVDYVDETYTLEFKPGETPGEAWAVARVHLLNDTVEDGNKRVRVALVNPTGGVPISPRFNESTFVISDNERGYSPHAPASHQWPWMEGDFYEGPEPYITIYRLGDYVGRTIATISFLALSPTDEYAAFAATPDLDFRPSTVEVEFAPGQTSARVPIPIVNDTEPEPLEYMKVQFSASVLAQQPLEAIFPIRDNEFNPLPVAEICPLSAGESILAMHSSGHGRVMLLVENPETGVLVKWLDANGAVDRSFPAPEIYPDELQVLPDGKILAGSSEAVRRFNEDGTLDAGFQPYFPTNSWIHHVCPGLDGKVFVALSRSSSLRQMIRLNSNGTVDSTFTAEVEVNIREMAAAQDGGVYVSGSFGPGNPGGMEKLTISGSLDSRFAYVGSTNAEGRMVEPSAISIYGEDIYIAAGGMVQRLLADGTADPAFVPFELSDGFPILRDGTGRFYSFVAKDLVVEVQRQNPNGSPDPSYVRGTIQGSVSPSSLQVALLGDDKLVILASMADLNGVRMRCANPISRPLPSPHSGVLWVNSALARVELNPAQPRITTDSGGSWQLIEETEQQPLTVVRTGDNRAPLKLQYRLRSGTSHEGKDFMSAGGTLQFEAGRSHVNLPISVIDNVSWARPGFFYLDILNAEGVVITTLEVPIASWDIGLDIANRTVLPDGAWRVPVINEITPSSELWSTKDFKTYSGRLLWGGQDAMLIAPTAPAEFYFLKPSYQN